MSADRLATGVGFCWSVPMDAALPPTGPASVTLSRDLRMAGFDQAELRRLTRAGDLVRVRRGAYAEAAARDSEGRHRQLIAATLPALSREACVSHQSAAVLHGLPMWPDLLDHVHVIRSRAGGGRRGTLVHVHPAPLNDADVVELDGMAVTSLARTVADCARTLSFTRGVGVGDAALRAGLTPGELVRQLDVATGRPGVPGARRTAAFLDGRAENFGESLSRVVLRRAGLPTPDLQFEVFDPTGQLVARTDFAWAERRTVAEFDGKIKYGRLLRPGETGGDVIFREKVREDLLRDLGWEVVRWIWADLRQPRVLAERLERAFARAARR